MCVCGGGGGGGGGGGSVWVGVGILLYMCHTVFICSEVAGLLLIDPAVETLFDGGQSDRSREDKSHSQSKDHTQTHGSAWSEYWYTRVLPPMQSVQVSASLGFNRIGLMLGLMSPVEEPELKRLLPEEAITVKVNSTDYFEGLELEKSLTTSSMLVIACSM